MYRPLILALLILGGQVQAHTLEPAYRIIRFHQGYTRFPMEAINAFNYREAFEVEVFEDDSFSTQLSYTATPQEIILQPMGRREFNIEMDEVDLTSFLVCTRTNVDSGSSRVCSRVFVCESYATNTQCKKRLSKRRGEYLIGR